MEQTLEEIWPGWKEMPLDERVARLSALAVAPTGINFVTKQYVDNNWQKYLRVVQTIIVEVQK